MSPSGVTVFISLLAVHRLTAMGPDMMPSMMNVCNYSMMSFPPLPSDFNTMAKKLMAECLKMEQQIPMMMDGLQNSSVVQDGMPPNPFFMYHTLLSSPPRPPWIPSPSNQTNNTMEPLPYEMDWNMTVKFQNCSYLPDMIALIKNSSGEPNCFMRTFVAHLSWKALLANGSEMDQSEFRMLLLAAKPFLQSMLPKRLVLPPNLRLPHVAGMVKMFDEVFGSLTLGQRVQFHEWVKERILRNYFNCSMRPRKPSGKPEDEREERVKKEKVKEKENNEGKKRDDEEGEDEREERVKKEKVKEKENNEGKKRDDEEGEDEREERVKKEKVKEKENNEGKKRDDEEGEGAPGRPGRPPYCRPRMKWLNATVMEMMGRFLTLLPGKEFKDIPSDQLCIFFRKPQFPTSFRGVGGVPPSLGKKLLETVKGCFQDGQEFLQHLGRLGNLACFYDDPKSLNASMSEILLSQLEECENSRSNKLKKKLVLTIVSSQRGGSLSPQLLQYMGTAVSVLPLSQLNKFKPSDLRKAIASLRRAKWMLAQAMFLARHLLNDTKSVSGQDLLNLGSVVRGVTTSVLRKFKAKKLMETGELDTLSQRLSVLQRTAVLEGLLRDVNASELVHRISGPLIASLSLSTLEQANLHSVDQLEGKSWNRAQSVLLLKNIIGKEMRPKDIMKLKSALRGVTCEMINSVNQSEVLAVAQALTGSMHWLSKTQICCAAKKLFFSLKKERKDYFINITDSELKAIPTPLLVHLPVEAIRRLPDSVCSCFLDKMSEANLTTLPLSSFARSALTDRALACLGKNTSDLSSEDITTLGPLVCELGPSHLSDLGADAHNATLLALAMCLQLNPKHRRSIFQMLRETYGDPSDWSSSTMTSVGSLLLLNDTAVSSLSYKAWLKDALLDLLESLPSAQSPPAPEEFRIQPDLSLLHKKIFYLTTNSSEPSPATRRKREVASVEPIMLSAIEELGERNVYWSPDQLAYMSPEVFSNGVYILGEVVDFNPQQLEALRNKTIQVWGKVDSLSESQVLQLGCVSQAFSPAELKELNITSLDTLELLSLCGWSHNQIEAVWQGYVNHTGMTVGALGAVEMVGLGQFICGLSLEEIRELNTDAFREALSNVGRVECPFSTTQLLKEQAVLVFGQPSNWTEAQVNTVGNIIIGLNNTELMSLNPSVFAFIIQSAIPRILPGRLAALLPSQLQALGPDNAAMVNDAQKERLGENQLVALGKALGTPYILKEVNSPNIPTPVPQQHVGLNNTELMSLNPSVFAFIIQSAIPRILPGRLAALLPSQLQALGPDNAAMVNDAQKERLGENQLVALGKALGTPYILKEVNSPNIPTPVPQQHGERKWDVEGAEWRRER
ncbi:hypothetical protein AAFF_G00427780 [Aldrovandia affinis]|uniref:Stereocilin LRR domain-containing protein n=1 Tax=Aldrovandia affinis TaxID=143900 RepID=A0AAD7SA09_9TELE|nr:hypothetical protein AAFF_G00427780 [Aldrovandia affinis]